MVKLTKPPAKRRRAPNNLTLRERVIHYFSCLKDHELTEFEFMLSKGDSHAAILQVMRDDWGHFVNLADRTVKDKISQYSTFVLRPKTLSAVQDIDVYKDAIEKAASINAAQEMSILVIQQKTRVERILKIETLYHAGAADTKDVSASARKEVKILADMLEKLAKVQLETGALRRVPRFISGEFQASTEKDPMKLTFNIAQNFMDTLKVIEGEFSDIENETVTPEKS